MTESPMSRWLTVMEAFAERDVWGVRELAAHTGLPRSAVHRMLHEMTRLGLLIEADAPGRFRVGPSLARLSVLLAERLDVRTVARPIMEGAAAELDETLVLTMYSPVAAPVLGHRRGRIDPSHPLHLGSAAPVERAPHRIERQGHPRLPAAGGAGCHPRRTARSAARIWAKAGRRPCAPSWMRRVLRGHVISHGERFPGAVGVSAPIRDAAGRVVGDLVFGWPDNRTSIEKEARAAALVMRAAAEVSGALGYRALTLPSAVGIRSDANPGR